MNFVTNKKKKLAPKKSWRATNLKENKSQIEQFKAKTNYVIRIDMNPFRAITVDEVLANLLQEEDIYSDNESEDESEQDEEFLYYINDDSEVDKDSEEEDFEEEV